MTSGRGRFWQQPLLVAGPAALWMTLFFVIPLIIIVVYGFATGQPGQYRVASPATTENITSVFENQTIRTMAWRSAMVGAITATVSLTLGLPVVYWLRFSAGRWQFPVLSLIIATIFAGYLVRIYAWRTILGGEGIVNSAFERLNLIDEPLQFLIFGLFAVIIAEVHIALPFAVLMLFSAIQPLDSHFLEAGEDLGAGPVTRWRKIILPLLAHPIATTWMFIFVVSSSDFITPRFLGGTNSQLIGVRISSYFRDEGNYGRGAGLALVVIASYVLIWLVIRGVLRLLRLQKVTWD